MYADILIDSATLDVVIKFQNGRFYKDEPINDTITYLLFVMEYYEDVEFTRVKNDEQEMEHFEREFEDGVNYFLRIDNFLTNEEVYPMKQLMETMVISGTDLITMGMLLGRRYEMGQIARILNRNFEYATEEDKAQWQEKYFEFCNKIMDHRDKVDSKKEEEAVKEKIIKYTKWIIIAIIIFYIFF